jgi:hypothetical protein
MRVQKAGSSTSFSNHFTSMTLGKKPVDTQVRFSSWPGLTLLEGPVTNGREGLALIRQRRREEREMKMVSYSLA